MLSYASVALPLNQGFGFDPAHNHPDFLVDDIQRIVDQVAVEQAIIPDGGLDGWLQQNFNLSDIRAILCPRYWPGPRQAHLGGIQWPDPPKFRLNTLYWPMGASRSAVFHFFATDELLTPLEVFASSGMGEPYPLVIESGVGQAIEAQMYMLPPKPVTVFGNKLYLMTLVDQRYFWADLNSGDFRVLRKVDTPYSTTWQELIDQVSKQLDVDIQVTTDIEDAYGNPHPSLTSRYTNAAVLLDAIAANLGRRVVVRLDGSVLLRTVDESQADFQLNGYNTSAVRAGGNALLLNPDFRETVLPDALNIVFRKKDCNSPEDAVYSVPVPASEFYPGIATNGTEKVFQTTAVAYYDEGGSLTNPDQISPLATLLARSFFGHQASLDVEWAGIVPLVPEGISDCIMWEFSAQDVSTRLVAQPYISGLQTELQHSFGFDPGDRFVLGADNRISASSRWKSR